MKEDLDSPAAAPGKALAEERAPQSADRKGAPENERMEFGNRKLIRPSLPPRSEFGERSRPASSAKKPAPPEQTSAEAFYYQKQMQTRTAMVVVLNDGEELRGVIEWYDRDCIKLNRSAHQPNLLIYKTSIKYLFKQSETNGRK